jgi:hypothetical protein
MNICGNAQCGVTFSQVACGFCQGYTAGLQKAVSECDQEYQMQAVCLQSAAANSASRCGRRIRDLLRKMPKVTCEGYNWTHSDGATSCPICAPERKSG